MKRQKEIFSIHTTRPCESPPGETPLPDGWVVARIRDVVREVPNAKPESEPDRQYRYIDISSIDNENYRIVNWKQFRGIDAPSRARRPVQSGDVLFSNVRTYLRNIALVPDGLELDLCSTGFTVLRSNGAVDPEFLFRYVLSDSYIDQVTPQQTGTHYPATSDRVVFDQTIPLPPLAEQRRIVARVEALLGRVQAARARLAKVPALLKRFRQSVLAAACSGELTQDLSATRNIDDSSLPDGWTTMSVASVCECVVDCPHSTPKWSDSGVACLRTTNFRVGKLDLDELRYVSEETYKTRVARLVPRAGDVVYSREGGILGIACTIPQGLQACLGQRMMLMRPGQGIVSAFLMHVLNSPRILARVRELTGGTASPHLNVGDVKAFPIPLPPLAEQHEIVRRVEALFALADKIESRVALATQRVEKTTQAILAKAFRGELVPTEAELARQQHRDYEPASLLLERIRADRKMVENQNVSRKAARRKQRKLSDGE